MPGRCGEHRGVTVLSPADVRSLRLRAQRLAPRDTSGDAAAVVRAVGAIQSQDPRAAALALRARGTGFHTDDVERMRVQDRSAVRTWCQRATMHLVPAEDVGWLLRLLGPTLLAARERNFRRMGLDEDTYAAAARVLRDALADGPMTRAEIGQRWEAAGIDASGSRLPHMITRAAIELEVCDGPDRDGERTWVRLADWAEVPDGPEGEAALSELARRYLAGHGPAEPRDLAAWSGVKVSDARAAWTLIGDQLEEVPTTAGPRWLLNGQGEGEPVDEAPVVRLLGGFDAYLLGYHDRELAVPPPHTKAVSAGGLRVLPAVTVDGVAVATWRLQRRRGKAQIEVQPFSTLEPGLLDQEVADIGRFLNTPATLT
ncbi:MAG: winged helix DNA-binding domain-containing protein [Nitriliruptorales bacterium]|nr:winged helix DNA-binding domain-containing protein [Nitriliruptorales bacterium]